MTEKVSVLPLHHAAEPVPIALAIEPQRARVGIAVAGAEPGTSDLYLTQAATDSIQLDAIVRATQIWVPAILGALAFNQFECHGDINQTQPDTVVALQALAVNGLDQLLQERGQSFIARPNYISQFQSETRETLHTIHETDDGQWLNALQPAMAQAGGMGEIVVYRAQTPDQLRQLQVIQLPGLKTTPDLQPTNSLVTQAFSQELLPRLRATNVNYEQLIQRLVDSAEENLPITESLKRSVGLAMRKIWNGK